MSQGFSELSENEQRVVKDRATYFAITHLADRSSVTDPAKKFEEVRSREQEKIAANPKLVENLVAEAQKYGNSYGGYRNLESGRTR